MGARPESLLKTRSHPCWPRQHARRARVCRFRRRAADTPGSASYLERLPSASGWTRRTTLRSMSEGVLPVAAVIAGSRRPWAPVAASPPPGIIWRVEMIFFWWVASLTTTPARPPPSRCRQCRNGEDRCDAARSARVHQSPTSSKSHSGRVCPDMKAITLPHPAPSRRRRRSHRRGAFAVDGEPSSMLARPDAAHARKRPLPGTTRGRAAPSAQHAGPRPVTRSARLMPSRAQAAGSSARRPGPAHTVVGSSNSP